MTFFLRSQEQAADLFACHHLLEQNKIDAILSSISKFTFSEEFRSEPLIVAKSGNSHPSDVERALYMLGFLAYHLPNVVEVVESWEDTGKCIAISQPDNSQSLKSPLALQAEAIYDALTRESL